MTQVIGSLPVTKETRIHVLVHSPAAWSFSVLTEVNKQNHRYSTKALSWPLPLTCPLLVCAPLPPLGSHCLIVLCLRVMLVNFHLLLQFSEDVSKKLLTTCLKFPLGGFTLLCSWSGCSSFGSPLSESLIHLKSSEMSEVDQQSSSISARTVLMWMVCCRRLPLQSHFSPA